MCRNKKVIIASTAVAAASAVWHILDEANLLQDLAAEFFFMALWLVIPLLNAAVGLWTKSVSRVRAAKLASVIYAVIYFGYATNGSTEEREGVGHFHLIYVPVLVLIVAVAILLVSFLDWIRGKWEN